MKREDLPKDCFIVYQGAWLFGCNLECPVQLVLFQPSTSSLLYTVKALIPSPCKSHLTTRLFVFRSPWRPRRTHGWRHPTRCSVHREDRHLRKHRGEGPADQKGCHATRVCARWLEDHQSALRGLFARDSEVYPVHPLLTPPPSNLAPLLLPPPSFL